MDLCEIFYDDVGTLEVDVFFPWDRWVCFCGAAGSFFGFEGGGEVEGVNCCWGCVCGV
jgi:hypothetical protein